MSEKGQTKEKTSANMPKVPKVLEVLEVPQWGMIVDVDR